MRSLLHMQEWLSGDYQFQIVTRNHDLGDRTPYPGVTAGRWCNVGEARVWYVAEPCWAPWSLRRVLKSIEPDLLYFHSSFDPAMTIVPLVLRRMGWFPAHVPVLVAPRGEFATGARSIKAAKKTAFLAAARVLRLYKGVSWHATNQEEAGEVRALWGADVPVMIAPNLPSRVAPDAASRRQPKGQGRLRLVFMSRIAKIKNLNGALEILRGVKAHVELDIYGALEDAVYWKQCGDLIRQLPPNISANYRGVVAMDAVHSTLSRYDALLLPTFGENFGHAIFEALSAGCPVLVSDQTPWRNLESDQAGFDIPLGQPAKFRSVIEQWAAMGPAEFQGWSEGARRLASRFSGNPELIRQTRSMIESAMVL